MKSILSALVALVCLAHAGSAAAVDFQGAWPAADEQVDVDLDRQPMSEALQEVAHDAGLGLVVTLPDDPPVTLHVAHAPLREVLTAILGDRPVVVRRIGSLMVVQAAPGSAAVPTAGPFAPPIAAMPPVPSIPAIPPIPPVPPMAAWPGMNPNALHGVPGLVPSINGITPRSPGMFGHDARDRVSMGGDVHVRAGEHVHDAVTMGGDLLIEGEVLGDAVTMGGDVHVRRGGIVHGSIVTMGGEITVDEGAHVRGDRVANAVTALRHYGSERGRAGDEHASGGWWSDFSGALARYALLFMLGLVLIGLAPQRLGALQRTLGRQPARAAATGITGFVGSVVLVIVLAITVIGIPAAIIVALGMPVAVYLGLTATATVLGALLPMPWLKNQPVMQLAAGCALLFVVSRLPFIGGVAVAAAAVFGFGAVLLTRMRTTAPSDTDVSR